MPRKTRMYLPFVPCHITSRGNNRDACFYAEQDYQFYLDCLNNACTRYGVALHAYVLMTNHVHLLMTPQTQTGISRVMQSIGRRYVQYINMTYRRSGTLWEGRHKACLVDAEGYLLACYRYIELNPVRASMVLHPAEYQWSSYKINAGYHPRHQLTPHDVYISLGKDEKSRCAAYRQLFAIDIDPGQMETIRRASTFSMPLGNHRFQQQIQAATGKKLGYSKLGRPRTRK